MERLAPISVMRLLDTAIEVVRFRFRVLMVLTFAVVVPVVFLPAALARRFAANSLDAVGLWMFDARSASADGLVLVLGQSLAVSLTAVGVTHLVMSWSVGVDPAIRETLRIVLRRSPAVVGAWLLTCIAVGVGSIACFVGFLLALAFLMPVPAVIAAEHAGPVVAIRRSVALSSKRVWPLLGLVLVERVIQRAIVGISALLGAAFPDDGRVGPILVDVVGFAVVVAWVPFAAAVAALVYVDLRIRREALDIEAEIPRVFAATGRGFGR